MHHFPIPNELQKGLNGWIGKGLLDRISLGDTFLNNDDVTLDESTLRWEKSEIL